MFDYKGAVVCYVRMITNDESVGCCFRSFLIATCLEKDNADSLVWKGVVLIQPRKHRPWMGPYAVPKSYTQLILRVKKFLGSYESS